MKNKYSVLKKILPITFMLAITVFFPQKQILAGETQKNSVLFPTQDVFISETDPIALNSLKYATVCDGRAYHLMRPVGQGIIVTTYGKTYYGQAWQCDKNDIGMVTEGNPTYQLPQKIGHYATSPTTEPITGSILIIRTDHVGYTSGTKLGGYHFQ